MLALRGLIASVFLATLVAAQAGEVAPNENLVTDGIPKIPTAIAESVAEAHRCICAQAAVGDAWRTRLSLLRSAISSVRNADCMRQSASGFAEIQFDLAQGRSDVNALGFIGAALAGGRCEAQVRRVAMRFNPRGGSIGLLQAAFGDQECAKGG